MPRKGRTNGRKLIYWWNEEISSLRKECLRYRRRQTRARSDEARQRAQDNYKDAKKKIKWAIQASKTKAFKELRDTIDENPWGSAYKIVLTKIKGINAKAPTCPKLISEIVCSLFPQQQPLRTLSYENTLMLIPPVTPEEILSAAERIDINKSPGLD